jgi:ferritin-like metal-binding protein YciE
MEGILKEGEKVMAKDATGEAMDAAVNASAQKVEHHAISGRTLLLHPFAPNGNRNFCKAPTCWPLSLKPPVHQKSIPVR